jgi:hypothetical protein
MPSNLPTQTLTRTHTHTHTNTHMHTHTFTHTHTNTQTQIVEEEAIEWKESLCYQLLRVTQDAYVARGTVLRSVTKSYELN